MGNCLVEEGVKLQPVQALLLAGNTAFHLALLVIGGLHRIVVVGFATIHGFLGGFGNLDFLAHIWVNKGLGHNIVAPCHTAQTQEQQGRSGCRHRFLGADHALKANFGGQQVHFQRTLV